MTRKRSAFFTFAPLIRPNASLQKLFNYSVEDEQVDHERIVGLPIVPRDASRAKRKTSDSLAQIE